VSNSWVCLTRDEAERAAAKINAYWAKRGHEVNAHVVKLPVPGFDGGRSTFGIRSDLINGLPPKRKRRAVVI